MFCDKFVGISDPCTDTYLMQDFSNQHHWHFGLNHFSWGTVLCTVLCLVTSLTSTHYMPVESPRWDSQKCLQIFLLFSSHLFNVEISPETKKKREIKSVKNCHQVSFSLKCSLFFFFGPLLCLENLNSSFYMDSSVTFLLVHWSSLTTAPTPVPQLSKL